MTDAIVEKPILECPACDKSDEIFYDGSATVPVSMNEDGEHQWDFEWIEFYSDGVYVCAHCSEQANDASHFIKEPGIHLSVGT